MQIIASPCTFAKSTSCRSLRSDSTVTTEGCSLAFDDSWCSRRTEVRAAVRFAHYHDQTYDSPWVLVSDDSIEATPPFSSSCNGADDETHQDDYCCYNETKITVSVSDIWYSEQDNKNFKQSTRVFARMLFQREERHRLYLSGKASSLEHFTSSATATTAKTSKTWIESLQMALEESENIASTQDVKALIQSATAVPVDAFHVGLEKWAIPSLRSFRSQHRRALYATVNWIQSTGTMAGAGSTTTAHEIQRACRAMTRTNRLFAVYVGNLGLPLEAKEM
eukprot:scaffold4223_cov189-Amphora_coffeaeformis.AAC.30